LLLLLLPSHWAEWLIGSSSTSGGHVEMLNK
jgi:hypothetical protein